MRAVDLLSLARVVAKARAKLAAYDLLGAQEKLIDRHFNDPHGLAEELQEGFGLTLDEIRATGLPISPKMRRRGENPSKSFALSRIGEGGQSKPRTVR